MDSNVRMCFLRTLMLLLISLSTNSIQARDHERISKRAAIINRCYELADSCYNCGNYTDAIKYAQQGIMQIKRIKKEQSKYVEFRKIEAFAYGCIDDYSNALIILQDLIEFDLKPIDRALIYYNESICYVGKEDWSNAIKSSEQCLNIIEDWDDAGEIILDVKLTIARCYARLTKYDVADEHYRAIFEFVKQTQDLESLLKCCSEIYEEFYNVWFSNLVIDAISELILFCEHNNCIDEYYCNLLYEKGINAHQLGDFSLAYATFHKALEVYSSLDNKNYYDNFCFEFTVMSNIATAASRLKKYDEAYTYFDKAEKALMEHSDFLYQEGKDQLIFNRAIIMLDEGINIREASQLFKELLECESAKRYPVWKATVYYNLGVALDLYDMDAALEAYTSALPLLLEHLGAGVIYAKTLNRIATIHEKKGDFVIAMQYYETAIGIFRRFSSTDNHSLVLTLCNAALCAYNMGEIGRAIAWGEEARNIQITTNVGIIELMTWNILLYSYERVQNVESYNQIYDEYKLYSNNGLEAIDFIQRELKRMCAAGEVEHAIEYINSIESIHPNILTNNTVNIERYILPEFNNRFDSCMTSWQTKDPESSLFTFAKHLRCLGEYDSAHIILKYIYESAKTNSDYLAESIYTSEACGDLNHFINIVNSSVRVFRNQLKSVLGMSLSEKEIYWKEMSFLKNLIGFCRDLAPISKQLFDISLIYKNFLVNSEVTFLRTLEQNGDKKVKSLTKELRLTKELLASSVIHNYNVDSLTLREIELNRQIVQNLNNLSEFEYSSNVCCDSIERALGPNEVAIEISDYSTNDNKYYVAMILRKGFEEPILIELGEESKFASLYNIPIKKLYDPYLPYSTELYELIWNPITPYLNKSDVIYISPSGVLSKLAIEALSSDDGIYVSELYDIKRVTSTAYILEHKGEYAYESSCIFGGVQYDSNINASFATKVATWDSGYLLDRSIHEDIPYLPGTKTEAEMIYGIFTNSKSEVTLHISTDANEYVFKNLSGTAPEIIHIATHGFYIPQEDKTSYRYYTETSSDLAMERSGLMLAGANDAWNGKLTPGVEDGILTASEIAKLDLSRTNLVVMSACETGLGDVTEDGIEGLQRAFKSAGVETLVMSLWEVDDKATELLMTEFYNLLLKGYNKDDAFQLAKKKVRSKRSYSSPYYWASFIMLD